MYLYIDYIYMYLYIDYIYISSTAGCTQRSPPSPTGLGLASVSCFAHAFYNRDPPPWTDGNRADRSMWTDSSSGAGGQ